MNKLLFLSLLSAVLAVAETGYSQVETATAGPDSSGRAGKKEIVLDEIIIEAVVEKPNVAILPLRPVLDFGELEFADRSFAAELKAIPDRRYLFEKDFDSLRSLRRLRRIVVEKKE